MLTRLLLIANIAVFAWTSIRHVTESEVLLIQYGAFYGPAVADGEWWRIFTAGFLHGTIWHIALNMFALWQVGTVVEDLFGTPKTAFIYLFSLVGSGWAILTFNYSQVTIGASGAIFGLFGALAAAGLRLRNFGLVRSLIGLLIINVLYGLVAPNISQAGHFGGLVAGLLAGLLIYTPPRPRQPLYVNAQHGDNIIEAELLPPEQRR